MDEVGYEIIPWAHTTTNELRSFIFLVAALLADTKSGHSP